MNAHLCQTPRNVPFPDNFCSIMLISSMVKRALFCCTVASQFCSQDGRGHRYLLPHKNSVDPTTVPLGLLTMLAIPLSLVLFWPWDCLKVTTTSKLNLAQQSLMHHQNIPLSLLAYLRVVTSQFSVKYWRWKGSKARWSTLISIGGGPYWTKTDVIDGDFCKSWQAIPPYKNVPQNILNGWLSFRFWTSGKKCGQYKCINSCLCREREKNMTCFRTTFLKYILVSWNLSNELLKELHHLFLKWSRCSNAFRVPYPPMINTWLIFCWPTMIAYWNNNNLRHSSVHWQWFHAKIGLTCKHRVYSSIDLQFLAVDAMKACCFENKLSCTTPKYLILWEAAGPLLAGLTW